MDFHTLLLVNATTATLSCIALAINFITNRGRISSIWMPAACGTLATGLALLAFRAPVGEMASIGLGNPLILLSFAFFYRGYAVLARSRSKYWFLLVALALIGGSVVLWFRYGDRNIAHRIGVMNFCLAIEALACLRMLASIREPAIRRAAAVSMASLGLFTLLNLVHGMVIWNQALPDSLFAPTTFEPWFMPICLVLITGLGFGQIWITTARQSLDLEADAYTDVLTGLPNRRALETEAEREISGSLRKHVPLAVIMCDLDEFKSANDLLGHHYGDAVLRAVATSLKSALRQEDFVARAGGDEFVILLPETDRSVALEIAERMRAAIEGLYVVEQGHSMKVNASFGAVTLNPFAGDTWKSLLVRADVALYAAKRAGGNHVVMDDALALSPVRSTAPRSTVPPTTTIQ